MALKFCSPCTLVYIALWAAMDCRNVIDRNLIINNITSLESGAFHGLANLQGLFGCCCGEAIDSPLTISHHSYRYPQYNQIASIESGDFFGLDSLTALCAFCVHTSF
jgi:hypothetical protein